MAPSGRLPARLAMMAATFVWGTTFVVVQQALVDLPVFHLLTLRFALGAVLLVPLLRGSGQRRLLDGDGLVVGLALFAGYALQTAGLLWTTPARAAFLTGLSVIFVPLLAAVAWRRRPPALAWAGAALATAGLWLLYRPEPSLGGFGRGDLLCLGCAVAFAVHVLLVERSVRRRTVPSLAVSQFLVVALLSAPSLIVQPFSTAELTPRAVSAVLITGVLATAVAFLCQLYAQRRLSATETAVMLALEPVVAAAVSIAARAEPWSWWTAAGGGLVVAAMIAVQLAESGRPAPS